MKFTAYNIQLPDGRKTINDNDITLAESNVWKSIVKSIELFLPKEKYDWSKLRVADLGCLEGGYALEFAKLGFDTVGIEARDNNLEKCFYLKEQFNLPKLNFVKDDVRNISAHGKFDIVLNYGLLYHLNDPVNFLKITADNNGTQLLFLNTHFAPEEDFRYSIGPINQYFLAPLQKRTQLFEKTKNYRLSAITTNEGYRGRWFREWSAGLAAGKIEKKNLSAFNNNRSFWLCKKDLTKALHQVGYRHVFEQFDYTGDLMPDNYTHFFNRAMFVAIK